MSTEYYVDERIYATSGDEAMIAVGVFAIIMVIYLLIMGLGIANYVLTSLSMYKIASRRQLPNPWMAWLPFASDWLIGSIVDEYDGRNGIKRKWRIVLLALSLIAMAGLVVTYVVMFVWILVLAVQSGNAEPEVSELLGFILIIYIAVIICAIVATAQSFCKAICVYKIFESTVPEKSVMYLLLYLLVPLAGAICLYKCKDKGYPQPQVFVPVENVQQYREPASEPIVEVPAEEIQETAPEVEEAEEIE